MIDQSEVEGFAERMSLPRAQFRCVDCGYGASRHAAPERCPMCGGSVWEHEPWRPFSARTREAEDARAS